jgi:hypothetical protein
LNIIWRIPGSYLSNELIQGGDNMKIQDLENMTLSIYDVKDQLKRHVYNRSLEAFALGDTARDAIQNAEQLDVHRAYLRTKFIENIGGLPSMDTPLNAKVTGLVSGDGFSVEKVIFESRPNTFVTANLYVPESIILPCAAVILFCGHHETAKHHEEYQKVCQHLVHAGLIVMVIDPIGQGERFSYYEAALEDATVMSCTGEHDYAGSQCLPLGDALARYFVHDGMRAVDYLCTRPEVDPDKIGITGNSGGGTQVSLMMVCDPRIAAAVPATFIMNRATYLLAGGAQDAEQIWPGMSALGFDHEDILLAMAPKPVLVLAVTYDFFPIEGTRRTVERTRRFWDMYGAGDRIGLAEDDSVHKYTSALARKAAEFFAKHLMGKEITAHQEVSPFMPSLLWCTDSGQVRGEITGARAVHDENADRVTELEDMWNSLPEPLRKERAKQWLGERVFQARKPCELNPRFYMLRGRFAELQVYNGIWWAQENIHNHGMFFRDFRYEGIELPLTIAIWNGGTQQIQSHLQWLRQTCADGRSVMVLDVSGVGPLMPHTLHNGDPSEFYEVIHKLTDDMIWLDDSLAAMRVYDVTRALDLAERLPHIKTDDIGLYVHGRQGFYGTLAAYLDRRIKQLDTVNGMGSAAEWIRARHYDERDIMSVVLPGMLKYFDLPDIDRWTAQDR